jgi:hypothetical protein
LPGNIERPHRNTAQLRGVEHRSDVWPAGAHRMKIRNRPLELHQQIEWFRNSLDRVRDQSHR